VELDIIVAREIPMTFYYAAGSMGDDGQGQFWHKYLDYEFPDFVRITKTITRYERKGTPYLVLPLYRSFWNRMALPNKGIDRWLAENAHRDLSRVIVSIHGSDSEIEEMVSALDRLNIYGIELNFSCPNVANPNNSYIPASKHPLSLKLNCYQDPCKYDMSRIFKVSVNSVPTLGGGVSGLLAQKKNWAFIRDHAKRFPVSGCSWQSAEDLSYLSAMGCTSFDIGTVMLLKPGFVRDLTSV